MTAYITYQRGTTLTRTRDNYDILHNLSKRKNSYKN
jgi:hypothetical protein